MNRFASCVGHSACVVPLHLAVDSVRIIELALSALRWLSLWNRSFFTLVVNAAWEGAAAVVRRKAGLVLAAADNTRPEGSTDVDDDVWVVVTALSRVFAIRPQRPTLQDALAVSAGIRHDAARAWAAGWVWGSGDQALLERLFVGESIEIAGLDVKQKK